MKVENKIKRKERKKMRINESFYPKINSSITIHRRGIFICFVLIEPD